jgi:hypothetical protein
VTNTAQLWEDVKGTGNDKRCSHQGVIFPEGLGRANDKVIQFEAYIEPLHQVHVENTFIQNTRLVDTIVRVNSIWDRLQMGRGS